MVMPFVGLYSACLHATGTQTNRYLAMTLQGGGVEDDRVCSTELTATG